MLIFMAATRAVLNHRTLSFGKFAFSASGKCYSEDLSGTCTLLAVDGPTLTKQVADNNRPAASYWCSVEYINQYHVMSRN